MLVRTTKQAKQRYSALFVNLLRNPEYLTFGFKGLDACFGVLGLVSRNHEKSIPVFPS